MMIKSSHNNWSCKLSIMCVCFLVASWQMNMFGECQMSDLIRFEQSLFSRSFDAKEIVCLSFTAAEQYFQTPFVAARAAAVRPIVLG